MDLALPYLVGAFRGCRPFCGGDGRLPGVDLDMVLVPFHLPVRVHSRTQLDKGHQDDDVCGRQDHQAFSDSHWTNFSESLTHTWCEEVSPCLGLRPLSLIQAVEPVLLDCEQDCLRRQISPLGDHVGNHPLIQAQGPG